METIITSPELLTEFHDCTAFDSGEPSLDGWLRKLALANQKSGAPRTYVITDSSRVIAYYSLATGAVSTVEVPGRMRRNMPDPIPIIVLGRLAVDLAWQGMGIGFDMLRDAVIRTLKAAEIVGIRLLLVHALNEKAAGFYEHAGFDPSPLRRFTYMLLLEDVKKTLSPNNEPFAHSPP